MLTSVFELFVVTFEVQIRLPQDYNVRSGLSNSVQLRGDIQLNLILGGPGR